MAPCGAWRGAIAVFDSNWRRFATLAARIRLNVQRFLRAGAEFGLEDAKRADSATAEGDEPPLVRLRTRRRAGNDVAGPPRLAWCEKNRRVRPAGADHAAWTVDSVRQFILLDVRKALCMTHAFSLRRAWTKGELVTNYKKRQSSSVLLRLKCHPEGRAL